MSLKPAATRERASRIEPLTRIATGGMADIWLSREVGAAGLERLVVVKRLLPHLAREPEIVDMFVSEARFVARLVHPNVVQIHDLGEDDEGYFLVMEYVAGCAVSELLTTSASTHTSLPFAATLSIADQACRGAHAAHELCDPTGRPLGLVHRDISPHNLMVGPSGEVKLLDFGIAKATAAAEATRTGSLKGKHGYMSPEQCSSAHIDRRSDVFALGIVCWELLTGARLFKRESEYATMHAIVNGDVQPPSTVRPDLPAAFDDVIARALAVDLDKRFQTADAFRRALLAAGEANAIHPSRDTLLATMTALLGPRLEERERALRDAARSGRFPEPQALRAALVQHAEGSVPRHEERTPDTAATVVQRRSPSLSGAPPSPDHTPTGTTPHRTSRDATLFDARPGPRIPRPEARAAESASAESATAESASAETASAESASAESSTAESTSAEPAAAESTSAESAAAESATSESATAESATSESATTESAHTPPPEAAPAKAEPSSAPVRATPETPSRPTSRRLPLAALIALAATAVAIFLAVRPPANTPSPPLSTTTSAAAPPTGPVLHFGVPPTVAPTVLRSELAPFLVWLGRTLGRPVELVIAESYDNTGDMVASGRADVALLPPLLFVRAHALEPRLQPLAVRLFDGSRASDGYLLVRDDSTLSQPADLRGHRICYVDRASTTGFLLPRIWLRKAGLTPDKDVQPVISGDHIAAMRDLAANKCDAAAVYSGAYLTARQEGIAVGRLRVLGITGRVPQDALVATPHMAPADLARLRTAILTFDPRRDIDAGRIGEVLGITGFAEFHTSEFDAIREAAQSEGLVPKPPPPGQ